MTTTQPFMRTNHGDGIVEIGLNRGPVNALSAEFLIAFADILGDLAVDVDVRAVVLSSPFKVFSAGIDLKEAMIFSVKDQTAMVHGLNTAYLKLFTFPKPIVTAIGGAAIAGGLFFVLASDYRIASPRAKFGLAEVRVGVDFPIAAMEIARASLGPNSLRRMMLTGQPIGATQAHAEGIVDKVLDADNSTLLDRALDVARELAISPAEAYARVKRQIRQHTITRIETEMANSANLPETDWFTAETRTAMKRMISGG